MKPDRRMIGVSILFVISISLTAFWNDFVGIIYDLAANLYFTGLATVAVSLPLHIFIVRRLLPRTSVPCQLLGVAISGIASIVIYDLLRAYTVHYTYLQRQGSSVNWGDDGKFSGLGVHAIGIRWATFRAHLPVTLTSACIYGIVWFPCLICLERWSYRNCPSITDRDHNGLSGI